MRGGGGLWPVLGGKEILENEVLSGPDSLLNQTIGSYL